MELFTAIETRRSISKLIAPAPSDDDIKKILHAAQLAPDHGRLKPWHFLLIRGVAREALGELYLEAALADQPDLAENRKNKIRDMPLRAPLVIVVVAKLAEGHKVPESEQIVATGAGVQNMLLAIQALNYSAMWRTGDMAYNQHVKAGLALAEKDVIVANLYVGTAGCTVKGRDARRFDDCVQEWTGIS